MNGIVKIQLWQFALVYLLLIIAALIMKKCRVNQTKLLMIASLRMTVQLILAGLILTYIFKHPHPAFTLLYFAAMTVFAVFRILSKNKTLNLRFKAVIALSVSLSGAAIVCFFICAVVGVSIFNPQYVIPIGGMVMGNTMTGVSLGVKTFRESLAGRRSEINALMCAGAPCDKILLPFVRRALETALLPTLNSMVGMGIVSLPGMMTGQILSGTMPATAILYQIAIMIAICTVVCLACFGSLYFGSRTLYSRAEQIVKFNKSGD